MSIFTETFPQFVQDELNKRQKRLNNPAERVDLINHQSSRNAWIRMTSGVEVIGKPDLAKQYILQGGTLNDGALGNIAKVGIGNSFNNAYSSKGTTGDYARGIRPMPGIVNMTAECKTAYGSLFEATVNFTCWDIKQLEDLELLFMRPGYTVLLEWGWYDNKNPPKFYDILDKDKDNLNFQQAYKDIFQKSIDNEGNYEALLGYIKNYQWSARPDGGYDCTTYIIALGEVLESLKINYAPLNVDLNAANTVGMLKQVIFSNGEKQNHVSTNFPKIKNKYSKGILSGLLYEIQTFMVYNSIQKTPEASALGGNAYPDISFINLKGEVKPYSVFKKNWNLKNTSTTVIPKSSVGDYNNYYISLGSLCDLVNEYVIPKNVDNLIDNTLLKITTKNRTYVGDAEKQLECLAHPLQISTNPTKVLIKGDLWIKGKLKITNSVPKPEIGVIEKGVLNLLTIFSRPQLFIPDRAYTDAIVQILADKLDSTSNMDDVKNIFKSIRDQLTWSITEATNIDYTLSDGNKLSFKDCGTNKDNLGLNLFTLFKFINEDDAYSKFRATIFDYNPGTDNLVGEKYKNNKIIQSFFDRSRESEMKQAIKELAFKPLNYNSNKWGEYIIGISNNTILVNTTKTAKESLKGLNSLKDYFVNDNYDRGYISNIYLDIDYLHSILSNSYIESKDVTGKNIINIFDFFKNICQTIQESIGNINTFDVHIDGRDSKGRIVDLNITSTPTKLFQLEIHNTLSTVRNYKLESKIFPEQGAIIAISAQGLQSSGQLGYSNGTLTSYNRGIKDRLKPKVKLELSANDQPSLEKNLINSFVQLNKYFDTLTDLTPITYSSTGVGGASPNKIVSNLNNQYNPSEYGNALRDVIGYFSSFEQDPQQFTGIIPTVLSVGIDGIGGIVIGNLFKVNDDILPTSYKGNFGVGRELGYLVKNFTHKIENNDWITTIEAYPFLVPSNKKTSTSFWNKFLQNGIDIGDLTPTTTAPQATQTSDNVAKIVRFFLDKGFSEEATAGVVGNLQQESNTKIDPTLINHNSTLLYNDSTQTYAAGIAQWVGDRRVNLLKYARNQGTSIEMYDEAIKIVNNSTKTTESLTILRQAFIKMTVDIQLNFTLSEMQKMSGFNTFIKSQDINYTTNWVWEKFEGKPEYGQRGTYANNVLADIKKGKYKLTVPLTTNVLNFLKTSSTPK